MAGWEFDRSSPQRGCGMSSKTSTVRLTPSERFARGLKYSTVGPVDVTRGAVGLGVKSVHSSASWLGGRCRSGKLPRDSAAVQESTVTGLAAAQELVYTLPQALQEARRSTRRRP